MADRVFDRVLDLGLTVLDTEASHIFICSAEPSTYTEAAVTYALGSKNFGAGNVCGAPAAGAPNGRKVTAAAITDGVASASGNATKWAICDVANSRLLARGSLLTTLAVVSGNGFTLTPFDIRLPSE